MKIEGTRAQSGDDADDPNATGSLIKGLWNEKGMEIRSSAHVSVENVEFTALARGLAITESADVAVSKSEFHEIRSDGVDIVGSRNVVMDENYFHDFHPWRGVRSGQGDHPDFIQLIPWGDGVGIDNLTISDNVMLQGDGGWAQTIFGWAANRGDVFSNIEISGNFIQNSHIHGIALGDVVNASIHDNILIPSGSHDPENTTNGRPGIDVAPPVSSDIAGNIETYNNPLAGLSEEEVHLPHEEANVSAKAQQA